MSALDHLSDAQLGAFVAHTRAHGGATMDVRTGALLRPGKRAFMVGGEPDQHGNRIPTTYVPTEHFGVEHVRSTLESIHSATGGRARTSIGSWMDEGNVELDASARTRRPGEAMRKARSRGEKAIWDNARMREVRTN